VGIFTVLVGGVAVVLAVFGEGEFEFKVGDVGEESGGFDKGLR